MSKRLPFWMFFTLMILPAAFAVFAGEPSASELLDKTLKKPGHWSQMCYIPPGVPFDVPFPLYGLMTSRYSSLSEENSGKLLARRAEIASLVVKDLQALDLSKAQSRQGQHYSTPEGLENPHGLSGVLLEIILELHLVEALPELHRLEADLNQRLEEAARDPHATLPELGLDSPSFWQETGSGFEHTPEHDRLYAARIYQRELLSTMAALLRHEKFQPLLASSIEDRYRDYLTGGAKTDQDLRHIKKPADIPADSARWISFDPVYHLPVKHDSRLIPYTPELGAQIRQFVKDYLALAPGQRGPGAPAADKK